MTTSTDTRSPLERWLGDTEPVRRALYPIIVAVAALLVGYGLLDERLVPLWLALAVGVLGIGGTEAARHVAYSPATHEAEQTRWQAALETEYAHGLTDGLGQLEDEPGEHAADRLRTEAIPTQRDATTMIRAASRATRCREVDEGRRCQLTRDHDGPHHMTTG